MIDPLNLAVDNLTTNVLRLMRLKNISEAELARKTGIPQPTLHKILTGKTEDPRASTLKALADFFDISIDELLTGTPSPSLQNMKSKNAQSIAIISWSDCINATHFINNLSPANWNNWVVSEFLSDKAYALISKPSMEHRFPKGTILIVDPETAPKDGDLVVAHYPNTNEATIRELSTDGPTRLFLSICKNTVPTEFNNEIKILGVIVKSIFSFH